MAASTVAALPPILPYSMVVGQEQIKLALELAFIAPRIGGVLISGQRGTGKSTAVRAFAQMMYPPEPADAPQPPIVTLPINATEDRVVGGWRIDELLRGDSQLQPGLLKEADGKILYVDEVNLLDDHIVNIILDVTSTGILSIQRDGISREERLAFLLVGTMNPEEGLLRPQLLDRFGLMVHVVADPNPAHRAAIIDAVLTYDAARSGNPQAIQAVLAAREQDRVRAVKLQAARRRLQTVDPQPIVDPCVRIGTAFEMQGHRGDLVMLTAARALAAREDVAAAPEHLRAVAQLALQHRRKEASQGGQSFWRTPEDDELIEARLRG